MVKNAEKIRMPLRPRINARLFFETNLSESISLIQAKETPAREEKNIGMATIKIIEVSRILLWKT